jgi:hypothetical protein
MTQAAQHADRSMKVSLDVATTLFSGIIRDLPAEAAERTHDGATISRIAPIVAHALFGEDMMLSEISGQPALISDPAWQERTGIRVQSLFMTPEWLSQSYNVEGLRAYADAVFGRISAFVDAPDPEALARQVPTPLGAVVSGQEFLTAFGTIHLMLHAGEIAALKGVQGLPGGLPM